MESIENGKTDMEGKITSIKTRKRELFKKYGNEFQSAIIAYQKEIEAKYPDAREYRAFTTIIGGDEPELQKYDLPGEDSVESFLKKFTASCPSTSR